MKWKIPFAVIFLLFIAIFSIQNYEIVTIKVLFWSFSSSVTVIVLASLLIGITLGAAACLIRAKKSKAKKNPNADYNY